MVRRHAAEVRETARVVPSGGAGFRTPGAELPRTSRLPDTSRLPGTSWLPGPSRLPGTSRLAETGRDQHSAAPVVPDTTPTGNRIRRTWLSRTPLFPLIVHSSTPGDSASGFGSVSRSRLASHVRSGSQIRSADQSRSASPSGSATPQSATPRSATPRFARQAVMAPWSGSTPPLGSAQLGDFASRSGAGTSWAASGLSSVRRRVPLASMITAPRFISPVRRPRNPMSPSVIARVTRQPGSSPPDSRRAAPRVRRSPSGRQLPLAPEVLNGGGLVGSAFAPADQDHRHSGTGVPAAQRQAAPLTGRIGGFPRPAGLPRALSMLTGDGPSGAIPTPNRLGRTGLLSIPSAPQSISPAGRQRTPHPPGAGTALAISRSTQPAGVFGRARFGAASDSRLGATIQHPAASAVAVPSANLLRAGNDRRVTPTATAAATATATAAGTTRTSDQRATLCRAPTRSRNRRGHQFDRNSGLANGRKSASRFDTPGAGCAAG